MNTTLKNNKKYVCFKEIKQGEVFKYQDDLFMKIEEIEAESENIMNAIFLADGELINFYDHELVFPLKYQLIINEEE